MKTLADKIEWTLFTTPAAAWTAMYKDCAAAQHSIDMEEYIFQNDAVGQKFLRLFIKKAKASVAVRLFCDQIGSEALENAPLLKDFQQSGGVFKFYNSPKLIDIIKPQRFFPRTHLKVLVIDSAITYVGGVCIAAQMKGWRDTQLRVAGQIAQDVKIALDHNFYEKPERNSRRSMHEDQKNRAFTYVQNDPALFRHPLLKIMLKHIREAKQCIYISSAYFVPPWRLRRQLIKAARRGVRVIVLCPENSDVKLADWASLSFATRLLKSGVQIFHYQKSVLHAKTAVIDDSWATIGSCNMDSLSLFHNREGNLIIKDHGVIEQMTSDFMRDLKKSRELSLQLMKEIPLWKRIAMHFARLLRPII